jgi:murein DD-endopeptidase MepM/ murein hydrolase activator NlpD
MIDVYSLNRGDQFEVIYEDQMVGPTSIGGKVLAARFKYSGKWIDAYQFIQNGQLGYFNEKGESLKRAFLKAPLDPKKVRISSRFSNSRMHPVLRIRRPHHGVDYAAPMGTPVVAIGDGKVIQRSFDKGSGNMVKIKHNSTYTSGYMHLSKFGDGVQVGSHVSQGQVIGYVGSTGLSTGPHLDFRVWQNGKPVDPLKIEAPPVEPIELRNKPAFDSVVKHYRSEFDRYKLELKGSTSTF